MALECYAVAGVNISLESHFYGKFVEQDICVCVYCLGHRPAADGQMAVRERIHLHHLVSARSHQFGEHRTRETISILVSRNCPARVH